VCGHSAQQGVAGGRKWAGGWRTPCTHTPGKKGYPLPVTTIILSYPGEKMIGLLIKGSVLPVLKV